MPLRRRDAKTKQLNVRMQPDELKSLDAWIKTQRRRAQRGRKQSGGWSDRRLPAVHNRRRSAARNQRPRRARWPDRRSIVFSATRDRFPSTNRKGESAGLQKGLVNFAKFAATSPSRRAEAQDVMLQPNRGAVVETGGAPCPMDCKLEDLLAILHDRHPPVEAACRPAVSLRVCCLQGRWVVVDLFWRLEPNWKSPVGRETLDDGGCNGNRILGDRHNYRACGRLRLCSELQETQRGAWTRTFLVWRRARYKRARGRFAGAKKNL